MAEPYEYRVRAALKAAFQAIAVAGGFYYGVADGAVVLDPDADVEALLAPEAPRPLIIIEPDDEAWEYFASGEVIVRMPTMVTWVHTAVPDTDVVFGTPAPIDDDYRLKVFHRGVADLEKAIGLDPSLGGLVSDARITNRVWHPGRNGQEVVAQVTLELSSYRRYGQPT